MRLALIGLLLCGCGPAPDASESGDPTAGSQATEGGEQPAAGRVAAEEPREPSVVELLAEYPGLGPEEQLQALDRVAELRDPAAIPILVAALQWRIGRTEEHAIRAARILARLEIPEAEVPAVVEALSDAFSHTEGASGVENRIRIETVRALGAIGSPQATEPLATIATRIDENQHFLINRLAVQQLARIADPAAVVALIDCLYLYAIDNPAMRMNDVAAEALVAVGEPALEPLLALLRGENPRADEIVEGYIAAVRQRDPRAASRMNVESIVAAEASYVLGALGDPRAMPPLLREARSADESRRVIAVVSLVRLRVEPAQRSRIRQALLDVDRRASEPMTRMQLLMAMRFLYDGAVLPYLARLAGNTRAGEMERVDAARGYAVLANASEAGALRALIERDRAVDDSDQRIELERFEPLLDAAAQCGDQAECWLLKLHGEDSAVARKACFMLARAGAETPAVMDALVEAFGSPELDVRLAALYAVDHLATEGSPAAVARIDQLQETEEGRSIWNSFGREARVIRFRLANRAPAVAQSEP